jgi:hypothetical protein
MGVLRTLLKERVVSATSHCGYCSPIQYRDGCEYIVARSLRCSIYGDATVMSSTLLATGVAGTFDLVAELRVTRCNEETSHHRPRGRPVSGVSEMSFMDAVVYLATLLTSSTVAVDH